MDPVFLNTPEYTVELWDINNVFVADITALIATSLRISMPLNDVEEVAFSIDLVQFEKLCASIGARPLNILEPYRTDVKVRRNGKYLVGAHVVETKVNFNADAGNKIEVSCTGYLNHLKDRYLTKRYLNKTYAAIARSLITDTQAAYNLIPNGEFWEGIQGWQYIDSGYIIWDSATGHNNNGSLFVSVTTGLNTFGGARVVRTMQAGVTYTATFWVRPVTTGGTVYITTQSGVNLASTVINTATWTQVTHTWTQPANSTYFDIKMSGSVNFWLDEVVLTDSIEDATKRSFGISLGVDLASANQAATRQRTYDLQNVKDAIINLTKLENDQFDFAFDANKVFNVWTRKGSDKAQVELVYPQNIESMTAVRSGQKLVNKVLALGAGIGNERVETAVLDQPSALTYRVRETVEMFNTVEYLSTLQENALGVLDQRRNLDDNIDVKLPTNVLDLNDVETGDAIYIRIDNSSYVDFVNGLYRIMKIELDVSQNFDESVSLELQKWE